MIHIVFIVLCFLCAVEAFATPRLQLKNTIPTYTIPYGTQLSDISYTQNINLIFLAGENKATTTGTIELLGAYSSLELQSATVNGYILLGDGLGDVSFIGKNADVHDTIDVNGERVHFEFLEGLSVAGGINIWGSIENDVLIRSATVTNIVSIGSPTTERNIITIENSTINGDIYVDGKNTELSIIGKTHINSIIDIIGNADITIGTPLSSFDFLTLDATGKNSISLIDGFVYTGQELPFDVLTNGVGNSLHLAGAKIEADIILPHGVDATIEWAGGTRFVGSIYEDTAQGTLIGAGVSHAVIDGVQASINNFLLALQDKTLWKGNLIGENLELLLVASEVAGDVILKDASSAYLVNSSIAGKIEAENSSLYLENIKLSSHITSSHNVAIAGDILYQNSNSGIYSFSAKDVTIHSSAGTLFSTYNGVLGDTLTVQVSSLTGYQQDMILFQGDVNFTTLEADKYTLSLNNGRQESYLVDYVMVDSGIYTDIRRIENVLQGFSEAPRLYRNTLNGYDVILEQNAIHTNNYDIVLLGYSRSNDAFAGAFAAQSLHMNAMDYALQFQLIRGIHVLLDRENRSDDITFWKRLSYYKEKTQQKGYATLNTSLLSGAVGVITPVISITERVRTGIEIIAHFGHSQTTIYDIEADASQASTTSIFATVRSPWTIDITPAHSIFIAPTFGGGVFLTSVHRPYSRTFDDWKQPVVYGSIYSGYRGKFANLSLIPYVGFSYTYLADFSFISEDGTDITYKKNHVLKPIVGFLLDYTIKGIRPYVHTIFSLPSLLASSPLAIHHREREYTKSTSYMMTAIGIEYTHAFSFLELALSAEAGLQVSLDKTRSISPHISLNLSFTF